MTEKFSNAAQSTLSATITSGQTTLVVVSATPFPTAGTFRLICGGELMTVTGVAGATFTIIRGAEGTAPAAHTAGVAVTAILTAGALAQLSVDVSASVTPTGTGVPHVVAGALQPAASLVVNADVDPAAAIAVTKLAVGSSGNVLTTVAGVPTWQAPAGGVSPTGNGIPHVVAGVTQTAASLMVDADVSASAAIAVTKLAGGSAGNVLTTVAGGVPTWQAPAGGVSPTGTASGSLGGSYPSPTVVQCDGAAGTLPVTCSVTTWGPVTNGVVSAIPPTSAPVQTTSNTATQAVALAVPPDTLCDFQITVIGRRTGGAAAGGAAGDFYRADFPVTYQRIGTAALSLGGAAAVETNKKSAGAGSGYSATITTTSGASNNVVVSVVGLASTNITWNVILQSQQVS